MKQERVTVIHVDDHQMILDGVANYLEGHDRIDLIGSFQSAETALRLLEVHPCTVCLMDLSIPGMSGQEATEIIKSRNPEIAVIALSANATLKSIRELTQSGASGYLLKSASKDELVRAILKVADGEQYFSSEITSILLQGDEAAVESHESVPLTPREIEILKLIVEQKTNQEIGDTLFISPRTVEVHKRNLIEKTNSRSAIGLTLYAIEKKIVYVQ